jgi:ABC-type transporter lipoprotein component MlaA
VDLVAGQLPVRLVGDRGPLLGDLPPRDDGRNLPLLIRRLGLAEAAEGEEEREETEARLRTAEAALARLDELAKETRVREDTVTRTRDLYEYRRRRFAARHSEQTESGEEDEGYEERSLAHTSVSGGSCWASSVRSCSGSGAKDVSATR